MRVESHHLIKTYREPLGGLALTAFLPLLAAFTATLLCHLTLLLPLGVREEDAELALGTADVDAEFVFRKAKDALEQLLALDRPLHAPLIDDQGRVLLAELAATAVGVAILVLVHLTAEAVDHAGKGGGQPLLVGGAAGLITSVLLHGITRIAALLVRDVP